MEHDPGFSSQTPVIARPIEYARPPRSLHPAMELNSISRRDAWLDIGLILLVTLLPHYLPGLVLLLLGNDVGLPDDPQTLIASKWIEAATVSGLAAYLLLRNRLRPATIGLRAKGILSQIGWGLVCLLVTYCFVVAVSMIIFYGFGSSPEVKQQFQKQLEFAKSLPVPDALTSAALLIAVAIHEETWFRGLLLPWLRRVLGNWTAAVIVSSLLFASLHIQQSLVGMLCILGLGILFSITFIRFRSLLAVMVAHFLFDFFQLMIARAVDLKDVQLRL
jgi:membrane protease YdiL (CAAX protease family)